MSLSHCRQFFLATALFLLQALLVADAAILMPSPPTIVGSSYLLVDFNSHKVLASKDPDKRLAPASLTKIMTAYVVFSQIQKKVIKLTDQVTVSEKAWKTKGSRMFLKLGSQVTIEKLLKGLIIQSGNDAAVALAEHVSGSEEAFVDEMNMIAESLKLENTKFKNSMGLPIEGHYTTAQDLITLTRALIKNFPEYYIWDSQKEFTYNKITQKNRNRLLWKDNSVDGVKTGYTKEAGYCMVASAKRNEMRLISVIMGTKSKAARASQSHSLLNYGFRFYKTHRLYKKDETIKAARIWKGERKQVKLGVDKDLYVTVAKRYYKDLKIETTIDKNILAPIKMGDKYGNITITLDNKLISSTPLIALETVEIGSIFQRFYDHLLQLIES
ncbi:MAG: D-alanyl-D-alanine carboxypeptidase [Methylococcales bacterium]|nr:D-alanyl-D-alanine carboxypeptidase [Methylococcales bacterium]